MSVNQFLKVVLISYQFLICLYQLLISEFYFAHRGFKAAIMSFVVLDRHDATSFIQQSLSN